MKASNDDNPVPTIGERYSLATESSNLRLGERMGQVDLIIAAGLIPDNLAATLYRLQVEYDCARGDHVAAQTRAKALETMASHEVGEDDLTGETAEERSEKIRAQAEHEALTAHVLILTLLTSLRTAKEEFGRFAVIEATRRRLWRTDAQVLLLAGRVLDAFLNPNCRGCAGRGLNGNPQFGELQVGCRQCRGTGLRRDSIGKDDVERRFAAHLLMQTDALMFQVGKDLHTGLNMVAEAKATIAEGVAS